MIFILHDSGNILLYLLVLHAVKTDVTNQNSKKIVYAAEYKATASGNIITLKAPMENPVAIRYAWKDNPLDANAYSAISDLPLSPFELQLEH